MRTLLVFFFLCFICLADISTSPTNYPYINTIDILNNYTQSNYYLKLTNVILTGEFVKDYNLNRITTYTTLKVAF